ncbi:MAG: aminotransferase class V-fold PLP-dependent enzyme, partial [Victivallales bacterium]|nr:aminotransferase class V-fold PLP-dependent enzyme [Victivallales bacterium]
MIYLDNAAAMPVSAEIAEYFAKTAVEFHANPESAHAAGKKSLELLGKSAERLKRTLGCDDMGVFFTTSATEAINTVLSFPGAGCGTVVVSPSLHPAASGAARRTNSREVRELALDSSGGIDCDDLKAKADASVSAVVVEHVQNETGRIQRIEAIGEIVAERAPNALFIVDTVQSVGKLLIPWTAANINIAFVGGHKIGAPCGGALLHSFPGNQTHSAKFAEHLQVLRSSSHILGRPDPTICATLAKALAETAAYPAKTAEKLRSALRAGLVKLAERLNVELSFPIPDND